VIYDIVCFPKPYYVKDKLNVYVLFDILSYFHSWYFTSCWNQTGIGIKMDLHICQFNVLDSVAGLATCYGLEGLEVKSRWGQDFPNLSTPAWGPTPPPVQWVSGSFLGVKRPVRTLTCPT